MEESFERRQQRALEKLRQAGALSLSEINLLRGGHGVSVTIQGIEAVIADAAYEPGSGTIQVTVSVNDQLGSFFISDAEVGGYITAGQRFTTVLEAWEAGLAGCVAALAEGREEGRVDEAAR